MPLDKQTGDLLLRTLADSGWSHRGDFIYAPNETMWLLVSQPWDDDLENLLERMVSRTEYIQRHKETYNPDEYNKILEDVGGLVSATQQLVRRKRNGS